MIAVLKSLQILFSVVQQLLISITQDRRNRRIVIVKCENLKKKKTGREKVSSCLVCVNFTKCY